MLQQILDRYESINQKRIRFLIDLLFHAYEIYNEFSVLNYFRLLHF